MSRPPCLAVALLLNTAQPILLSTTVATAALLVVQEAALAQSTEAVAKIAQSITVRIEGATQGSGVLVKRDGNLYTVLTAWHVVSGQRPGEELDIYTPDGQRHPVEQGSIKRLGEVDLAVLNFASSNSYEGAHVGDVKSVSSGSNIYVSGFPLPTSAVPTRLFRFLKGDVIANATVVIPNGYQLLYSNPTLPGMSGGAVLNGQGKLVGIHASAERADQISESSGKAVATGTNQAVPIGYYSQYSSDTPVVASSSQASSADDYLVQANALTGKKGSEQEVIRLSNQVLATRESAEAYLYRAYAKDSLGDKQGLIDDLSQAITIKPKDAANYYNRGNAKSAFGDKQGAIADYSKAIALNPQNAVIFFSRGVAKFNMGDSRGAINDYSEAIAISPQFAEAYKNRGNAKRDLGDHQGAIADYAKSISIDPKNFYLYMNRGSTWLKIGDTLQACADFKSALRLSYSNAEEYLSRHCQ